MAVIIWSLDRAQVLKPSEKIQEETLVNAFVDVLIKIAEGDEAVFCLPGVENCFEPTAHYAIDGVTERVMKWIRVLWI